MTSKSIRQQINSIVLLLMAGVGCLAAVAFAATLFTKLTFTEYRATAGATLNASAIFEDLFEARIAAMKWRSSPDDALAEEFVANLDEIYELEAELAELGSSDAFAQALAKLRVDGMQYQQYFEKTLEIQSQYANFDAQVSAIGTSTRELLTEIMNSAFEDNDATAAYYAGRTQESLMLARFYVERFRTTERTDHFETALSHLDTAIASMDTLSPELQNPLRINLAGMAREGLQEYKQNAEALALQVADRRVARDAMDALGPIMMADIEVALDEVVDRQSVLGARGQSIALLTILSVALASLGVAAFGWLAARKQTKVIVDSIEQSVETMSHIANGDLDAEVSNVESENELGRMARALEVFKTNGKAAIEAAEREKVLERERLDADAARTAAQEAQQEKARAAAEAERKAMISELSSSLGMVVSSASEGDFTKRVVADFNDGELMNLATSVNRLVENVENGLSATARVLERVADGDLTQQMEGTFHGAFAALQNNTNDMIAALRSLVGDITASGTTLASSSSELRDTSDVLSRQAEQNAASLEESSAALEELSASIKQVSGSVSEASENAEQASATAKVSDRVAEDAAAAMTRISEASTEIAQVVTVINDISFQINLLALNAGVEAARAGDAGRGFSVVASEVRQLAQRVSEAAKEIDSVITRSDTAVAEGVSKVADAKTSLASIAESVVTISTSVNEIAGAISEQVHGIGEITTAVDQIDRNTQKQAASFEEVTAASSVLASEAEGLKSSIARFRTGAEQKIVTLSTPKPAPRVQAAPKVAAVAGGAPVSEGEGWEEF